MIDALIIGAAIIIAASILATPTPPSRGGYQPKPSKGGLGRPPTTGTAVRERIKP